MENSENIPPDVSLSEQDAAVDVQDRTKSLQTRGRAMSASMENFENIPPGVLLSEEAAAIDVQDDSKSLQIIGQALSATVKNLENIPPDVSFTEQTTAVNDQDDSQSLQNKASTRVRESRSKRQSSLNYWISPINSEESDADISDTDPTFNELQTNKTGSRFYRKSSRSSSSSSSGSGSSSSGSSSASSGSRSSSSRSSSATANRASNTQLDATQINENAIEPTIEMVATENTMTVTPTTETENRVKSRKRKRTPSKWKQNVIKKKRNTGQAYESLSKLKKSVPAREMKPPCSTQHVD